MMVVPALLLAVVAVAASPAAAGGRPLATALTGAAEVPGPGDPDGAGTARLTLNSGQEEICFALSVSGIAPATAAHIHKGSAEMAGPVVVPLVPSTSGSSSGCVAVDRDLVKEIRNDPANYYVNVHNSEHPAGALRGQLSK
ncbi:MAG: CHRD domain-containing protein [Acidimicrobiales bacterium]